MKIWFDILTPKHLLFFEPMIKKLENDHQILCTSRKYREVSSLAKSRNFKLLVIGTHGGGKKYEKLVASVSRIRSLSRIIQKEKPDLTISFCSPEASRIAFGLGINHIAFSDSPHAEAVMKLSIPFVQYLLTPWVIPKSAFTKFGILKKNILHYKAIDASITLKRNPIENLKLTLQNKKQKIILVRMEEDQAAYIKQNSHRTIKIIEKLGSEFNEEKIIVLGRYPSQVKFLKKKFGNKVKILSEVVDGKEILKKVDVFIGSGGTMTAESALMGVPTISFNAVPNFIEDYLIRKKLVIRANDPNKIVKITRKILENDKKINKRAEKILLSMQDPYFMLKKAIKLLNR